MWLVLESRVKPPPCGCVDLSLNLKSWSLRETRVATLWSLADHQVESFTLSVPQCTPGLINAHMSVPTPLLGVRMPRMIQCHGPSTPT